MKIVAKKMTSEVPLTIFFFSILFKKSLCYPQVNVLRMKCYKFHNIMSRNDRMILFGVQKLLKNCKSEKNAVEIYIAEFIGIQKLYRSKIVHIHSQSACRCPAFLFIHKCAKTFQPKYMEKVTAQNINSKKICMSSKMHQKMHLSQLHCK